MNRYGNLRDELYQKFLELGVSNFRPLGNTIYILPPYTISNKELKKVYQAIENVIDFKKTSEKSQVFLFKFVLQHPNGAFIFTFSKCPFT